MRLSICAVGRLRAGPERALVDDYVARFDRTGRAIGLGPLCETQIETRKLSGPAAEAEALFRAIPEGNVLVVLDERGQALSSPGLSERIAGWRDEGRPGAAFAIGGAEGLSRDLRRRADLSLSLGPMVWPHMLVRVMLCEQLYRAASILANTPYHRA